MPELVRSNTVVLDGGSLAWADLLASSESARLLDLFRSADEPVAIIVDDVRTALNAAAMLADTQLDGLVLGRDRLSEGVSSLLSRSGYCVLDSKSGATTKPEAKTSPVPGRISLLTSGTTGTPKLVSHRWETLFTGRDIRRREPRRWLVPYQMGSYAWYQVVTLGLFHEGQMLAPADPSDMTSLFETASVARVDSISATPTFWRLALLSVTDARLQSLPLQVITLGGEAASQDILDELRVLYPAAQLTHIYATSEAGTCIVVKDGLAGFPASLLTRNDPSLPQLKIEGGKLAVRSPFTSRAAVNQAAEWIDTGDVVEQRGERVFFIGRDITAMINVGGNKAWPADIEAVLLRHPAMAWARVRAVRSPLVGQLPEADMVFAAGRTPPSEMELTEFCRGRLPEYAIPRMWNVLDAIPVQGSLKSAL
uniref:AMP-binding protein n=1 Tax=Prosthecobacter sp. TaxID=1965333 RepID=UPI003784ADAC